MGPDAPYVLATFYTQALHSALIATVLYGFQRTYRRTYLAYWSLSWAALAIYHVMAAITLHLLPVRPATDSARFISSSLSLVFGYWQPAWLVLGTHHLVTGTAVRKSLRIAVLLLLPAAAVGCVFATTDVTPSQRLFFRVGMRAFIAGIAFFGAAYGITRTLEWRKSLARRLLFVAFVIYASAQLHYCSLFLLDLFGYGERPYRFFLGFGDVVLQALIGLGMVIWHLEQERESALAAGVELRKSEEHLRHSQKLEVVGRLAGGVAHDFNNILTAMFGYSDFIREALSKSHPARPHVESLDASIERARALTTQLLAFSRKQVSRPRAIDLSGALRGLENLVRRVIGEDIRLTVHAPDGLPAVMADPTQIEQVLLNLVVNARDAMPAGGRLDLETSVVQLGVEKANELQLKAGRYIAMSVKDDGVGIDKEVRAHLFEPFFTTKPVGKGTGLGLSTVYGIVMQSKGAILAESEPSRGSRFTVFFPALEDSTETGLRAERELRALRRAVVLVVEDEHEIRALVERALREQEFDVLTAESGDEALAIVSQKDLVIDLLLTDIVMPGVNGFELSRRIRAVRPDLRVAFMSGYSGDQRIEEQIVAEGGHWVAKPFTLPTLVDAVRRALAPSTQRAP